MAKLQVQSDPEGELNAAQDAPPAFDKKKPFAQLHGEQGVKWVQGDWLFNGAFQPVRPAHEGSEYYWVPRKRTRKEELAEEAKKASKTVVGKPMEPDAEPAVVREARRENARAAAAEENAV